MEREVETFWRWFAANEARLFDFASDQERTFDRLAAALHRVDADLTFEFGPDENGVRDFVISAAGHKRAFPAVEALAKGAPALPRWRIVAFRPRRWPIHDVEIAGLSLGPKDVEVVLLRGRGMAGLHLFVPGYTEGDSRRGQAVYLMLDEALGQWAVETQLGLIKMFRFEEASQGERFPFSELPERFDRLLEHLSRKDA